MENDARGQEAPSTPYLYVNNFRSHNSLSCTIFRLIHHLTTCQFIHFRSDWFQEICQLELVAAAAAGRTESAKQNFENIGPQTEKKKNQVRNGSRNGTSRTFIVNQRGVIYCFVPVSVKSDYHC